MGPSSLSRLALPLIAVLACVTSAQMAIHHTVIAVGDLNRSLRFYRDGIGLEVLYDNNQTTGDWQTLFGAESNTYRRVYLGDSSTINNGSDGVLQLASFPGVTKGQKSSVTHPQTGFFLLSFWIGDALNVNSTLARLCSLGLGGVPREATFGNPPTTYATVR
ncbi:hypothetical protein B0O99DRAFT_647386, partial [Bisporella sp. PMI_857]